MSGHDDVSGRRPGQPPGLEDALSFPLFSALLGRRSRRFGLGMEIPDGALAFASRHPPLPLSELETLLVVTAMAGNTGWHNLIYRNARYAPHLSNYACAAGGRTFPSAAGFHTSGLFYTDDSGVYCLETRDAPALADRGPDGGMDMEELLAAHRGRVRKLSDGRLPLPDAAVEGHNTWVANKPGTLLAIPVADLAQHLLANLCYLLQNGFALRDDISGRDIPGLGAFRDLHNDKLMPLSFVEQWTFGEAVAELSAACFAGCLALQAMGLGGWMFNGLDPFGVLAALGFRADADPRWPMPNPTGLPGIFEALCPPHVPDMDAAVDTLCRRKFGPGGPFHPQTPGPFKDTAAVRSSALVHDARFRACVALQAGYILETFGRVPATLPAVVCLPYLQACHLDVEFYDAHFQPGAILETHRRHMERWHTP